MSVLLWFLLVILAAFALYAIARSIVTIGPAQVGLVVKRVSRKHNTTDTPIAFSGEAGYQAELLMPGVRFKLWPTYTVVKYPWVQVPAGEIGVVISQIGQPLPTGAKSAAYRPEFGNFTDLRAFVAGKGQKGVQRPVLPPGTLAPIHPVAFLVVTATKAYGLPVDAQLTARGPLDPASFGLKPEQFRVTVIAPNGAQDVVGIVTTLEGDPLAPADIACRIGGFSDIETLEKQSGVSDSELIESLLGKKNELHNNYQDFQAFLDRGGRIGLQHDPLLYGAYLLNPFLVRVEPAPMLVVNQGEVAVIKSYVGLPTLDTSGPEFKFGSIVQPGHRGIWREALRTGKYPLNQRIYAAEKVPTFILTLNWAEANSVAHNLDAQLSPIEGKSREGFIFKIDLQVQIHVPDTKAPKVISMVGSMQNLVNEVLQAAVGNHFRNTLQALEAVRFIETRDQVQAAALEAISRYLAAYEVETRGVYIQDVAFPAGARRGAHAPRDRQPGKGHVRAAEGRADGARRPGEGSRHGGHAGRAGQGAGVGRHQPRSGQRAQGGGRRRGRVRPRDRRGRRLPPAGDRPGRRGGRGGAWVGQGQGLRGAGREPRLDPNRGRGDRERALGRQARRRARGAGDRRRRGPRRAGGHVHEEPQRPRHDRKGSQMKRSLNADSVNSTREMEGLR